MPKFPPANRRILVLAAWIAAAYSSSVDAATAPPEQASGPVVATTLPLKGEPGQVVLSASWKVNALRGFGAIEAGPGGKYTYSGTFNAGMPGQTCVFTATLIASNGVKAQFKATVQANGSGLNFSQQGQSQQITQNYAAFASSYQGNWAYSCKPS